MSLKIFNSTSKKKKKKNQTLAPTINKNKKSVSGFGGLLGSNESYMDNVSFTKFYKQSQRGCCLGIQDLIRFLNLFNGLQNLKASVNFSHIVGAKYVTELRG